MNLGAPQNVPSPAGAVKSLFDHSEAIQSLQPGFDLGGPAGGGQPHHRAPGHAVGQDPAAAAPAQLHGKATGFSATKGRLKSYLLKHLYIQRELCILCWCSPPGSPLWSLEECETASRPAEEDQPLLLAPACSQ